MVIPFQEEEPPQPRVLICLRCGHGKDPRRPWIQRGDKEPGRCWKCGSPYWNRYRNGEGPPPVYVHYPDPIKETQ